MIQPPVSNMIEFTESWWGDEFNEALLHRIREAPFKHLEAFREEWPFHRAFHDGADTLYPELEMFELPPLEPGKLRPALPRNPGTDLSGLVLLLYSHSIVLSSALAAPFSLPGRVWEERSKKDNRRIVEFGFKDLLRLRPLIERNLAYFTNLDASPPFFEYSRGNDGYWNIGSALRREYPDATEDDLKVVTGGNQAHSRLLRLATQRKLSLVAQDDYEYGLFFNASDLAWKLLSGAGTKPPQPRPAHLAASTLARTVLPSLRTSTKAIAALHDDEILFNEWRESLHYALSMLGGFTTDPDELEVARGILAHELDASTSRLRAGLEKSSLSARLARGLKGFAIGASSALLTSFGDSLDDRIFNVGFGGALGGAINVVVNSKASASRARLVDGLVFDFRALPSTGGPQIDV